MSKTPWLQNQTQSELHRHTGNLPKLRPNPILTGRDLGVWSKAPSYGGGFSGRCSRGFDRGKRRGRSEDAGNGSKFGEIRLENSHTAGVRVRSFPALRSLGCCGGISGRFVQGGEIPTQSIRSTSPYRASHLPDPLGNVLFRQWPGVLRMSWSDRPLIRPITKSGWPSIQAEL